MKRLTKSNNKKICGVCAGVAEFFGIDPTIIRLLAVILIFCGIGTGIIVYIVAAFILPEPDDRPYDDTENIDHLKSANVSEDEIKKESHTAEAKHTDEEFNSYFEEK
ncbi:MAG: PspC domain-containing protein [Treponema sp.]|nr:PspC domain-containing protein [Treponema sp.]